MGDLRLVESSGNRAELFVGMARIVEVLSRKGVRLPDEPSKEVVGASDYSWARFRG